MRFIILTVGLATRYRLVTVKTMLQRKSAGSLLRKQSTLLVSRSELQKFNRAAFRLFWSLLYSWQWKSDFLILKLKYISFGWFQRVKLYYLILWISEHWENLCRRCERSEKHRRTGRLGLQAMKNNGWRWMQALDTLLGGTWHFLLNSLVIDERRAKMLPLLEKYEPFNGSTH